MMVEMMEIQQQDIVNYHYSVEQVKAQKKANDLIKPTHVELFETIKTNLIISLANIVLFISGYAIFSLIGPLACLILFTIFFIIFFILRIKYSN